MYIDSSKAQALDVRGVTYYRSEHGAWVRKEGTSPSGRAVQEREAFKEFISARMLTEAKEQFQSCLRMVSTSRPRLNRTRIACPRRR